MIANRRAPRLPKHCLHLIMNLTRLAVWFPKSQHFGKTFRLEISRLTDVAEILGTSHAFTCRVGSIIARLGSGQITSTLQSHRVGNPLPSEHQWQYLV